MDHFIVARELFIHVTHTGHGYLELIFFVHFCYWPENHYIHFECLQITWQQLVLHMKAALSFIDLPQYGRHIQVGLSKSVRGIRVFL